MIPMRDGMYLSDYLDAIDYRSDGGAVPFHKWTDQRGPSPVRAAY